MLGFMNPLQQAMNNNGEKILRSRTVPQQGVPVTLTVGMVMFPVRGSEVEQKFPE